MNKFIHFFTVIFFVLYSCISIGAVTTNSSATGVSQSSISLTSNVTGTLPVANGGTGTVTSTGTGNTVLSDSPTITGTAIFATVSTNNFKNLGGASNNDVICSNATPSISSGFGSGASIVNHNGTCGFFLNVGTGGTASSGVIGLSPATTNGWICNVTGQTGTQTGITRQIDTNGNGATIANFLATTFAQVAWNASVILFISCTGD